MRIKIKNLGPIYEFNFDLNKDLHLVYGKNNIGKSHGIAAVYLILKALSNKPNFDKIPNLLVDIEQKFTEKWAKDYGQHYSMSKFFTILLQETMHSYIDSFLLPNLNQSFSNSFLEINNIENKFSKEELSSST